MNSWCSSRISYIFRIKNLLKLLRPMISLTTYDHKKAAHLQQIVNIHYINTFRNVRHKNNIKDPNLIALSKYVWYLHVIFVRTFSLDISRWVGQTVLRRFGNKTCSRLKAPNCGYSMRPLHKQVSISKPWQYWPTVTELYNHVVYNKGKHNIISVLLNS